MNGKFLFYKRGRWFTINLASLLILTIIYLVWVPLGGHNGGTPLGYTFGIIAAAGIFYLMWYGKRKRSYHTSGNTLLGCLSAHVWIGLALAIIVPLHSGFQFGLNIHSLTYALMMIVIISGIFGAVNYVTLAPLIAAHRGGGHTPQLLEQIARLSKSIEEFLTDRSDEMVLLKNEADFTITPGIMRCLTKRLVPRFNQEAIDARLSHVPTTEYSEAVKMLSLIARKRELAKKLQQDVRTLALLKIWLWVHLPISLALVVGVIAHIVIVLWYR